MQEVQLCVWDTLWPPEDYSYLYTYSLPFLLPKNQTCSFQGQKTNEESEEKK